MKTIKLRHGRPLVLSSAVIMGALLFLQRREQQRRQSQEANLSAAKQIVKVTKEKQPQEPDFIGRWRSKINRTDIIFLSSGTEEVRDFDGTLLATGYYRFVQPSELHVQHKRGFDRGTSYELDSSVDAQSDFIWRISISRDGKTMTCQQKAPGSWKIKNHLWEKPLQLKRQTPMIEEKTVILDELQARLQARDEPRPKATEQNFLVLPNNLAPQRFP